MKDVVKVSDIKQLKPEEQKKYIKELLKDLNINLNEELLTEEEVFGDLDSERWNIKDAAEYLERSIPTVRRWIKQGLLMAYKTGRNIKLDYADLQNFKKWRGSVKQNDPEGLSTGKRMSLREACKYLSISDATMRRWIKENKVLCFKVGRKYEFEPEELKSLKQSLV